MGITLNVEGMSCQHCVANVKKSLEAVAGVTLATPDLGSKSVQIDGENLNIDQLMQAITEAGYVVKE